MKKFLQTDEFLCENSSVRKNRVVKDSHFGLVPVPLNSRDIYILDQTDMLVKMGKI